MKRAETDAIKSLQLIVGSIAAFAAQHIVPGHDEFPVRYPDGLDSRDNRCSARSDLATKCLDKIWTSDIWKIQEELKNTRLNHLLMSIQTLHMPDFDTSKLCKNNTCLGTREDFVEGMRDRVDALKQEARDISAGVCLDCFKAKATGAARCRLKH